MAKGVYIGVEKKPTLMLLHGDDLTESANNLPVTNNSVTVVDDTGAFGGKALNFSGSGQYLSIADNTLSLPGDFTIDFRLYNAGSTSWRGIFETAGATSSNWTFHKGGLNISLGDGSNLLFAGIARGGGTYSTLNTPANSVPVGTWSHIALVRSNGVMTFYINGVSSASLSDSEAVTTDGTILIGKHDIRDDMYLNGKIDEFRVSSVARWTSNFTPPTEAYPNDEAGVGIARKVKKMYYGVGNLAKEIKKGYIGIGGVARPFWTSGPGEPTFYGCFAQRNQSGSGDASAKAFNSKYAMFVCGANGNYETSIINAFSTDLIGSTMNHPYSGRDLSGCCFQGYAMALGGEEAYDNDNWTRVITYDNDLVRTERTRFPNGNSYGNFKNVATAQLDGHLFCSSAGQAWQPTTTTTLTYDKDFIQQILGSRAKRTYFTGSQNSNYVLFMGGYIGSNNNPSNTVEYYDSNFVKGTTNLSVNVYDGSGLTIHDAACHIGGYVADKQSRIIEAFDENLIRSTPTSLDFDSNSPCTGIFKETPFVRGPNHLIEFDSNFIKTTYNYSYDSPYTGATSDSNWGGGYNIQQGLLPVGDYLVYGNSGMNSKLEFAAFKFS